MSKKVLITIGIIGLLALMIHYFLSYDQPIRYGGGNIDPNNEEVIMDDESYNDLAKDVKELRFDIESLVERLEKEYADELQ